MESSIYEEKLTSSWTTLLFIALAVLFIVLSLWRVSSDKIDMLALVLIFLFGVFFFYSINYRVLVISIDNDSLKLKFGIFSMKVDSENVEYCQIDELPFLMKYGGAGIHFMMIRGRYRASYNFLEHPRVVIALKRKKGLVQDISFSTRHPEKVINLFNSTI